jgi:hypothetical protein
MTGFLYPLPRSSGMEHLSHPCHIEGFSLYFIHTVRIKNVSIFQLCEDYIAKRQHANALVEREYSKFVLVNLNPGLPPNNKVRRLDEYLFCR